MHQAPPHSLWPPAQKESPWRAAKGHQRQNQRQNQPNQPNQQPGGSPAPITQEVEQEAESGEVDLSFEVSNEGDYASQCTSATQFGNTGNFQNAPGFQQFDGEADDFEPDGIEFAFEPELGVECDSTIQQSAAASE